VVEKISRKDIDEVKQRFILANLRMSPIEAAKVLDVSVRTFYRLVEEGLIETIPTRPGRIRGIRCTAAALEAYRQKMVEPQHSE
jgi:excisionase family DNA binding protein